MNSSLVYLAGPISGCTYGECVDWRKAFPDGLPPSIVCLSPMRGKEYMAKMPRIETDKYEDWVLCSDEGIMARDFFDCNRADVVIFNMLGATRVSIGTVMEMAWAYARKIPKIFIMEKKGCLHDHPMIRRCIDFHVQTIDDAKLVLRAILDAESIR